MANVVGYSQWLGPITVDQFARLNTCTSRPTASEALASHLVEQGFKAVKAEAPGFVVGQ
jgi:hypothetical protein